MAKYITACKSEKEKFPVLIKAKREIHMPHFFPYFSLIGLDRGVGKGANWHHIRCQIFAFCTEREDIREENASAGNLYPPSFVDSHIHLDKILTGLEQDAVGYMGGQCRLC